MIADEHRIYVPVGSAAGRPILPPPDYYSGMIARRQARPMVSASVTGGGGEERESGVMRRPLVGRAAAAVAGMLLAAACGGSGSGAPSLSTPLLRVLGRVAATATTRTYVSFDDTSGLTALVGKDTFSGFGSLLFTDAGGSAN